MRSTVYREVFVLKIFRVTIIHVEKFSRTAAIEENLFLDNSDLAVLAVLSLTRRPSFFGKTRAAADPPQPAVINVSTCLFWSAVSVLKLCAAPAS